MERSSGHKALRRGRVSESGRIYHITFATMSRTPWFRNPAVAKAACRSFAPSVEACDAQLLCWMLMPDHFHGLAHLHGSHDLSRCVQRIKGRSSAACRAVLGASSVVWSRGFHDHAMRRNEDILITARYIVANPLRAGLAATVMDYPYWNAVWR